MFEKLKYGNLRKEYTEVNFKECTNKSEDDNKSNDHNDPILILKRKKRKRKIRSKITNLARIISKSGKLNIFLKQMSHKNMYYIRDLGNTLLGIRWRWIITTLVLVNVGCFLLFGTLWSIIARGSGDFEANNTEPCIVNTVTLTGYFLLSAETITTIGYGYRYPTERCYYGWLMQAIQVLFSMAVQGTLVSIVYVKITKPITTAATSMFSKRAVICMRDGKLRFVFRIHDFNKKVWCGTNISLYFMDKENLFPNSEIDMIQMCIEPHGLLIFPLEIEHVIDENSPLWTFRPLDILQSRFEIIAVAEGVSNKTGQVSQNRVSYSNCDILWGHRFVPCVDYDEIRGEYIVDYEKFEQVVAFDAPLCSAKKLEDIYQKISRVDQHFRKVSVTDNYIRKQ